jgi:photosystem II stability/assembly factor-like uncharacterized protein
MDLGSIAIGALGLLFVRWAYGEIVWFTRGSTIADSLPMSVAEQAAALTELVNAVKDDPPPPLDNDENGAYVLLMEAFDDPESMR